MSETGDHIGKSKNIKHVDVLNNTLFYGKHSIEFRVIKARSIIHEHLLSSRDDLVLAKESPTHEVSERFWKI